jgi:hypothetical protein
MSDFDYLKNRTGFSSKHITCSLMSYLSNNTKRKRIIWNGGALVVELTVATVADGGVATVADGGCCKKRKKGEEICRG